MERFSGDKCVNYRALKETTAKTCKHIQKTRSKNTGFRGFCRKNAITVRNVVWTVFLGVVVVLGKPPRGKNEKNTPWKDLEGGNRGPGRPGLRMAANLFERDMQRTCINVTQASNCVCQLLFADLKSRATPSATSSMLNAEFHSQYRLAKVSLSLCNSIFEIHISFQSSG